MTAAIAIGAALTSVAAAGFFWAKDREGWALVSVVTGFAIGALCAFLKQNGVVP